MVNTASKKQIQRFYESELGNIDTLTGTGAPVTALDINCIAFNYASIGVAATTKDATLDIDASVDGVNFDVVILHAHTVTAGTRHTELITNVGYRIIRVTLDQNALGSSDVFYNLK